MGEDGQQRDKIQELRNELYHKQNTITDLRERLDGVLGEADRYRSENHQLKNRIKQLEKNIEKLQANGVDQQEGGLHTA